MQARFNAYVGTVQRELMSPMFGELDSLIVLADLLSALHQGQPAFADARLSLAAAADALRWEL
jgi:predicted YcjX-like family ATPase